jgi:hypothetical protein
LDAVGGGAHLMIRAAVLTFTRVLLIGIPIIYSIR